jgi:hypothetical protein
MSLCVRARVADKVVEEVASPLFQSEDMRAGVAALVSATFVTRSSSSGASDQQLAMEEEGEQPWSQVVMTALSMIHQLPVGP